MKKSDLGRWGFCKKVLEFSDCSENLSCPGEKKVIFAGGFFGDHFLCFSEF